MGLTYQSTRGRETGVPASMAILKGLAEDGGLFMPTEIPELDVPMEKLGTMTYQETAYEVMKLFLTDYSPEELKDCITKAYDSKFDTEEMCIRDSGELFQTVRVQGPYLFKGKLVQKGFSKGRAVEGEPFPHTGYKAYGLL